MENEVVGFYDIDGNNNLWALTWRAPYGEELVTVKEPFVVEVRRASGPVLLSFVLRGTDRGNGVTSVSELRIR